MAVGSGKEKGAWSGGDPNRVSAVEPMSPGRSKTFIRDVVLAGVAGMKVKGVFIVSLGGKRVRYLAAL